MKDTSPCVLVIDDDGAIRALLRRSLEEAGYRVCEADSAAQALLMREAQAPALALLDLGLPDRDGLDILPQLVGAGLAVVVLSARHAIAQKVAALDLGADDYVTKPFAPDEMLARVRTALRHRARLAGSAGGGTGGEERSCGSPMSRSIWPRGWCARAGRKFTSRPRNMRFWPNWCAMPGRSSPMPSSCARSGGRAMKAMSNICAWPRAASGASWRGPSDRGLRAAQRTGVGYRLDLAS
jgi:CheY-like chemotaxis protein